MRPPGLVLLSALAGGLLAAGCTPGVLEVATLAPTSLTDGLIAHWAFDEGSGTVADDSSGNGRIGLIAGPTWTWKTPGQFGSALHFAGSDDVSAGGIPQPTPSYSVSAWVLIEPNELGAPVANLISTETIGGGWALYATLTAPQEGFVFTYSNAPTTYATATCSSCVAPGVWTHLAAVLDASAGTLTLYVSGMPTTTVPAGGSILPGSSLLYMARSAELSPAFPLVGALDDIAIWDRALVPEEVAALTQAPVPNPM